MIRFRFLNFINVFIYLFIIAPLVVVVISSFTNSEYLVFPPEGFSWKWYQDVLTNGRYVEPFWNSIELAVVTTLLSLIIGTLLAMVFTRYKFRGKGALQSLFLAPLVVPMLLLGIGLLMFYSKLGINATFLRLVLAHVVLTVPYVIRTMSSVFANLNRSVEEAASTLGATPWQTFYLVTLPMVQPALAASAFFSFILSFDELVLALFLTSPDFNTLPMLIYSDIQFNMTPAIAAISSIIILGTMCIGLVVLSLMRRSKIL